MLMPERRSRSLPTWAVLAVVLFAELDHRPPMDRHTTHITADAFLVRRSIPTPRRRQRCFSESPCRHAKRTDEDVSNRDNETNRLLAGENVWKTVAATTAALWLFGGNLLLPPSAMASGDIPEYLSISEKDIQIQANKKLVDYAVGTVNTQFYDSSGGARFNPSDFYRQWKDVQKNLVEVSESTTSSSTGSNGPAPSVSATTLRDLRLDTRDGTVETLKYLVSSLKDPYSKYMTREELQFELRGSHDGFLGTGAYIEVPKTPDGPPSNSQYSPGNPEGSSSSTTTTTRTLSSSRSLRGERGTEKTNFQINIAQHRNQKRSSSQKTRQVLLTNTKVANLPVVTAVAPNSPAERAGLVVGDKIVGVGDKDNFLGYGRNEIRRCLAQNWGYSDSTTKAKVSYEEQSRYFGVADLTIAKPVYSYSLGAPLAGAMGPERRGSSNSNSNINNNINDNLQTAASSELFPNESMTSREIVLGYRSTKVKLPTMATDPSSKSLANSSHKNLRGDAVVQYELLTPPSAGDSMLSASSEINKGVSDSNSNNKVGYIRLTRFSKSSTEGYLNAVKTLEDEGAQSYVIDLRNNYGGVIQEAMLTASTLLGDPHAILCYLLNARGGFTPVDVESYVVDQRYPGYLLSKEDKSSVLERVIKENPNMFRTVTVSDGGGGANKRLVADWDPPSSYASIHEQVAKRGIHRITYAGYDTADANVLGAAFGPTARTIPVSAGNKNSNNNNNPLLYRQRMLQQKVLQKDVVLLINEGTASSSEFFVAALQDNGRSLAVVGSKSFGKGLIQHTFPMPDGGGIKLTIGEFLRPSLRHVTNVFDVGFVDKASGEIVGGGGVNPDVYCESRQGVPGNPGADLCVRVALDVLEEHRSSSTPEPAITSSDITTAKGGSW